MAISGHYGCRGAYMDIIDILMGLIRSSREVDWMLRLASVRHDPMVLRIWQVEICTLSLILLRPDVSAAHTPPRCARCIHARRGFSSAWLHQPLRKNPCRSNDQINEEQGHIDGKVDQAVQFETRDREQIHFTAKYMAVHMIMVRDMIGQDSSKLPHPDLQGPMIRKDEADIKSLIDLMENNWLDPLSPDESDLVSLSTGTVIQPAMVKDLLRAFDVGEEAYQTFKRTRLDDDSSSVKFHDTMIKQRLKTFSTISTKHHKWKAKMWFWRQTETSSARWSW